MTRIISQDSNGHGDIFQHLADGFIEYISDGSVYIYDEYSHEVVSWIPDEFWEDEDAFAAAINTCHLARERGISYIENIFWSVS